MKINWPTKKLGEIAQLRMGETLIKRDLTGEGVPVYSANSLEKPWGFTSKNRLKFKRGSIVIGARGTIGSLKLPEEEKFTSTQTTIIIEPKKLEILSSFVFYFLNTLDFKKFTSGTGIPMITVGYLNNIRISIPPIPIQQKIIERLDAIRKAQELNEKQISLANELFQSLLHQELKPKKGWEVKKLAKVADILMGQSPPGDTYNVNRDGLPFLQGKAEFGEVYPTIVRFCSAPARIAHFNDVLLSIRAPVGPVNLASMDVCIGRGLSAIRGKADVLNQRFLFFFMKLNEIILAESAVGSTFSSVCKRDIENIEIYFPSLKIQRQIVKKLTIVLEYKKKLLEQKELLQELFESTLDEAMKGELVK